MKGERIEDIKPLRRTQSEEALLPVQLLTFEHSLSCQMQKGFHLVRLEFRRLIVNPAFIIILAPLMGSLWIRLSARNLNPNTPVKFGIGLIFMALGFLVMYFAAQIVVAGSKAGMGWLIFTYFLHSTGELTLSPVGLSATTKLAPRKYMGQMMGIWFVGAALGNLIAGLYSGNFDEENVQQMPNLFLSVVWLGVGAGLVFLALSPWMKRWMGKVE